MIVAMLTDFGMMDGYVGAMKGVVLDRAPNARLIDIAHDIPPQDIRAGAWALREASRTFPRETIFVAVVDPGVGTSRRPLLLESAGRLVVAPDNGLASWVDGAPDARGWCLDRNDLFRAPVSRTFHGRDIFASGAGHLAAGRSPESCGTPIDDWQRIEWPACSRQGETIVGEVVHIDRFGNLISNIHLNALGGTKSWQVELEREAIGELKKTFADVAPAEWIAYVGSSALVEIAVREESAAERGGELGACVRLLRSSRGHAG